jgi:hypothetical protein
MFLSLQSGDTLLAARTIHEHLGALSGLRGTAILVVLVDHYTMISF